jgi:hypothetical protein
MALVWTTFGTTPTAPTGYSARLWVPGSSMVVWVWNEGEELTSRPLPPRCRSACSTPAPARSADVTLTWAE